jgi:hypothetical protein
MSQWCEFYAEEPDAIAALLVQGSAEPSYMEHIDFQNVLHGGPDPASEWFLEALTRLAQELYDTHGVEFDIARFDKLASQDEGDCDDDDQGACVISDTWVQLMASVKETDFTKLAVGVVKRLTLNMGDDNVAAIADDVSAIVGLCKTATRKNLKVVYQWTL